MRDEKILLTAQFDPKLKTYWLVHGAWIMTISCVGAVLLPFWLLGLGQLVSSKAFERLQCTLTERSLNIRRGYLVRVEKTIPLDKIQDLAMHEGPILRSMGLCLLKVETAGQSNPQGGDAMLVGLVDAQGFRDAVLNQRDRVTTAAPAQITGPVGDSTALLTEIRDSLQRIEALLARTD